VITYTKDELERLAPNDAVIEKYLAAVEAGDTEEQTKCFRQFIHPPVTMLVLKETMGAEWIIEQGLDTSEADRKFGPGWMERDNDELAAILHQ